MTGLMPVSSSSMIQLLLHIKLVDQSAEMIMIKVDIRGLPPGRVFLDRCDLT